uniref:Protein kinase camp-dependent n=1 Tax=Nyssomyia neivai TaxID=330878 RepID=A0A1L8DN16_9DIPT
MPTTMMKTTAHKRTGRIARRILSRKFNRLKVLNLLKMETQKEENASTGTVDENSEFYNSGRVGRRNALPDILSDHCKTSTADLPDRLNALSTSDNPSSETGAGPSGVNSAQAGNNTATTSSTTPSTIEKT